MGAGGIAAARKLALMRSGVRTAAPAIGARDIDLDLDNSSIGSRAAAQGPSTAPVRSNVPEQGALGSVAVENVAGVETDIAPALANPVIASGSITREKRLRQLVDDPNVSSADRGWITSEMRQVESGNRPVVRNPPGKDLRHPPRRANAQGYDYSETQLQDRATHRSQHRYLVERATGTTIRVPKKAPKSGPELPE